MERKNQGTAPVVCRNWARTGNCTFGARCHFAHYDVQNASRNGGVAAAQTPLHFTSNAGGSSSSNQAANKPICRNWATTGVCKFGDRCHFSHAQPTAQQASESSTSTPSSTTSGRDSSSKSEAIPSKQQEIDQLGQKLHQLEITNSDPPQKQQQQQVHSDQHGGHYQPDDEQYWEEHGFEGEEGNDEDFDEDDYEGPQPIVRDGSSCRVEGCSGVLQPHFSEAGTLQYYLCSNCGALFTNSTGR